MREEASRNLGTLRQLTGVALRPTARPHRGHQVRSRRAHLAEQNITGLVRVHEGVQVKYVRHNADVSAAQRCSEDVESRNGEVVHHCRGGVALLGPAITQVLV
jgi:hypothetical protein